MPLFLSTVSQNKNAVFSFVTVEHRNKVKHKAASTTPACVTFCVCCHPTLE